MLYALQSAGAFCAAFVLVALVYSGFTFAFKYFMIDRWGHRDLAILKIVGLEWLVAVGVASGAMFYMTTSALLPFGFPDWVEPIVFTAPALLAAIGAARYIYRDYILDVAGGGRR